MTSPWPSLLLATLAAGSLVVGSALPILRTRFFEQRLSLLIGFSAGLMLATAMLELFPEALEADSQRAMWGGSLGFLSLYVAERLTHFHACRHRLCETETAGALEGSLENIEWAVAEIEDTHQHASQATLHTHHGHDAHVHHTHSHHSEHTPAPRHHAHTDTMALVGMSIHNFSDGLTTAAAFAVSRTVGLVVVLAIMIHQTAAGLSLGAILLRAGRHRRRVLLSTTIVASFIIWGALAYHFAAVGNSMKGIILGIAGGSFFYVAACDLLPEAHAEDEGWNVTAMTLIGYGFALGVKVLFG
ncbi:MAG: ZIP family metal transporter [Abitibacteriaceae bacterium]|nr:ZIP family metal transporter [Abditibacteriaceae bacterium]